MKTFSSSNSKRYNSKYQNEHFLMNFSSKTRHFSQISTLISLKTTQNIKNSQNFTTLTQMQTKVKSITRNGENERKNNKKLKTVNENLNNVNKNTKNVNENLNLFTKNVKIKNKNEENKNIVNKIYELEKEKKPIKKKNINKNVNEKYKQKKENLLIDFKDIENQRNFMANLYQKLKLNSLDDWVNVKRYFISLNGGRRLLNIYDQNLEFLLISIYPNEKWNFLNDPKIIFRYANFDSIEIQRSFFDHLFYKLNFNSFDDCTKLTKKLIEKNGGKNLFRAEIKYENFHQLFEKIYQNYPWEKNLIEKKIEPKKPRKKIDYKKFVDQKINFQSIEKQRSFFDELFFKLNFNSFDQFEKKITKKKIILNGGKIICQIYKNNLPNLLQNIYPNYPWNFKLLKIVNNINYFQSIENQIIYMENLYYKLKLNSLDDFIFITKYKIISNNGKSLLDLYKKNIRSLLITIFPNFPFQFGQFLKFSSFYDRSFYYKSIENQRSFFHNLFYKLKLNSFDDWMNISKKEISKYGGNFINYFYPNRKPFLPYIFPFYPWPIYIKKKTKKSFHLINSFKSRFLFYQKIYLIQKKKDIFRLTARSLANTKNDFFLLLKNIFPDQKWNFKLMSLKSKKGNQFLLFSYLQKKIFQNFLLIENYRHPKLISKNKTLMEYDIYIPSLNMGIEYQGEQHFDEIPSTYSPIDQSLFRDQFKENLSKELNIKIIYIPFWWDKSLPSLLSSLPFPFPYHY